MSHRNATPKVVFSLPLRSPHYQVAGVGGGATPAGWLEARDKQIDFESSADGVQAVFREGGQVIGREAVDLTQPSEPLAKRWMAV